MVEIRALSVAVSAVGALIAVVLLAMSIVAFRRNRDPAFAFLTGAFTIFFLKTVLVAYSLQTSLIAHEYLELVDAVGDVSTLLMITLPLLLPRR